MGKPTFISGAGPGHATDEEAYNLSASGSTTGVTLVTDTGVNYFEIDSAADRMAVARAVEVTPLAYTWACLEKVRLAGAMSAGDDNKFFSTGMSGADPHLNLEMHQLSDTSHYVLRLTDGLTDRDLKGEGLKLLAVDTYYSIRIQMEATGNRVKVWIDGTLDMDVDFGRDPRITFELFWLYQTSLGGSQKVRVSNVVLSHSDTKGDRPGTNVTGGEAGAKYPDGDMVTGTYGPQSDCALTTGTWTLWDDWASGAADDATTFNCEQGGSTGKIISTFDNVTVSNVIGIVVRARAAANDVKTVETHVVIRDTSANELEIQNGNLGSAAWRTFDIGGAFPLAPLAGGTAWTQTLLDNIGAGVRSVDTNGANDHWTAIFIEAFGIDEDAETEDEVLPGPGGVALGSANVGMY